MDVKENQPVQPPLIFDRTLRRRRLARSAKHFPDHDFIHRLIIADIVDRLETVTRNFDKAVVCGPGAHLLQPALTEKCGVGMLSEACPVFDLVHLSEQKDGRLVYDDEQFPFAGESLDLVVSLMSLHMTNDLPKALIEVRRSLKPDGLFLAAMPGEKTLNQLRACFYQAETEITGGVSPRIIPFAAIRDLGGLLQHAGFTLPVADMLDLPVTYRNPVRLLQDLRGMGESNVLVNRKRSTLRRDVFIRTLELYLEKFETESEDQMSRGVTASFDIIILTGWSPHHHQQRPLARGSAKASMAEAIRSFTKTPD